MWLVESNRDDPATVALLKGRYRQVEEPVTKLVAKVTEREVKLYDIVTVVLKPEVNLERVEEKLGELEKEFSEVEPVSAKHDVAMAVQEQHEVRGGKLTLFIRHTVDSLVLCRVRVRASPYDLMKIQE